MAFTDETLDKAFERSAGKCECTRDHTGESGSPHHGGKCPRAFFRYGPQWEPHHKVSEIRGGKDTLDNLEVLCYECHRLIHKPVAVAR